MYKLRLFILLAAPFLLALSAAPVSYAQQYREPLGSRCYNFDFGSNYGRDRYANLCDENITIALIFSHGGGSTSSCAPASPAAPATPALSTPTWASPQSSSAPPTCASSTKTTASGTSAAGGGGVVR